MNTKTPNLEIRFRTYRDSDAKTIRELFKNSMLVGGDSPMIESLQGQFTGPVAITLYTISSLGAFLAVWSPTTRIQYLGFFLSLLGTATFSFLLYTCFSDYQYFAKYALMTDLKDIPRAYGLTRETEDGEYVANGPNGFWVVEVYHAEEMYSEIVGCAGLDISRMNAHENAIELRRMVISSKYRRRGIASRLIQVLVAHARTHKKSCIDLTISSYQESSLSLYEKHGWVMRRRWVLMWRNLYTHQLRRYLN